MAVNQPNLVRATAKQKHLHDFGNTTCVDFIIIGVRYDNEKRRKKRRAIEVGVRCPITRNLAEGTSPEAHYDRCVTADRQRHRRRRSKKGGWVGFGAGIFRQLSKKARSHMCHRHFVLGTIWVTSLYDLKRRHEWSHDNFCANNQTSFLENALNLIVESALPLL